MVGNFVKICLLIDCQLPVPGGLYSVAYTDVVQLGCIAVGLVRCTLCTNRTLCTTCTLCTNHVDFCVWQQHSSRNWDGVFCAIGLLYGSI